MGPEASSGKHNPSMEWTGRYQIMERLGKGAMAVVYSALDTQTDRHVALKVLVADVEGDNSSRERFLREARVTGQLSHRNIVTVFDMGESDGKLFIVMELLEGRPLSEWLRDRGRTLEEKLDLMLQTCDGLALAHASGVVHRDVKPNNLFVLPDGVLKILDFGVARLVSSSITRSGLIVGTPDYMSPEQARGKSVDARSDIFSASAVFYAMLSGHKPFEGPNLPAVLHHVANDPPPPMPPNSVPQPLADIVMKGLAKTPEQRYQSMPELLEELRAFKRQFDVETRQIVIAARDAYGKLIDDTAQLTKLRAMAELPAAAADAAVTGLGERFGVLRKAPLTSITTSRREALEISAEVSALASTIGREVERLKSGVTEINAAEESLLAGRIEAATDHVRAAERELGSDSIRLVRLTMRFREFAAKKRSEEDKLRRLLVDAQAFEREGQWSAAERKAREALELRPELIDARAALTRIETGRAAVKQKRDAELRRLSQAVTADVGAGRFEEAEKTLGALRRLESADSERTGSWQTEISRLAARIETTRANQAEHGARREASKRAADAARKATVDRLTKDASAQWERGEVDAALATAEEVLKWDAQNETAHQVLNLARAKITDLDGAAERREQADSCLRRAVVHLAQGRFDRAAAEAQQALQLRDDCPGAAGLLSDATRLADEAVAERARVGSDATRAREVAKLLYQARVGLHTGDYAGALSAAERAVALDPSHMHVLTIFGQCRATVAAVRVLTADDTVRVDKNAVPGAMTVGLAKRFTVLRLQMSGLRERLARAWDAILP